MKGQEIKYLLKREKKGTEKKTVNEKWNIYIGEARNQVPFKRETEQYGKNEDS